MSRVPRWRLALGIVLIAAALAVLCLTLVNPLIGVGLVFVGVVLAVPADGLNADGRTGTRQLKIAAAVLAVVPSVALVFRTLNFRPVGEARELGTLAAGEYTGASGDVLGLIAVRAVLRAGPSGVRVVFAEAHAPAALGFHDWTLRREARRVLESQAVPNDPAPDSEPATAVAVLGAFRRALAASPGPPTVPEGGTPESYWGMFPDEYDHYRCNPKLARDGAFEGQSSNPNHPARVRVTFLGGRLTRVEVLSGKHSEYGAPAFTGLPGRFAAENRVDVDVVVGASRSSYILRSAVYDACRKAGGVQ